METSPATPKTLFQKKYLWLVGFVLLGVLLAWLASAIISGAPLPFMPPKLHGTVLQSPDEIQDFQLYATGNQPVRISDFRGKLVLLSFGYTSCPDVCPVNLTVLSRVMADLTTKERAGVQVIFVSVDPQRDTPERLAEYVQHFDASFIGITGTEEQVLQAATPFGIYYERVPDENAPQGYWVDHTATLLLIDKTSHLRVVYPFNTPVEDIRADVRALLN